MSYTISKEELLKWCSIPWEQLVNRDDLKVKLIVESEKQKIIERIALLMIEEIVDNNNKGKITKWVLPAGPTDQYNIFIEHVNKNRISLKNLWVFHMDEFLDWEGRPYEVADTYESLEGTMNACFYDRIDEDLNVPTNQRIWPRINDVDYPDILCEKLGGIDTVWAGVGAKGLVAFNEAPRRYGYRVSIEEYANSKTRIVELNDDTIVALSHRTFGTMYDRVPPKSITLGFKVMLSAKRTVMMITTGAWKQTVVRVSLFSEPTLEYPVTLFPKYVPEVIMLCNEETIDHPLSHSIKGW